MGIAAKYYGYFVTFAKPQYFQVVVSCGKLFAYGFQRTVIDFEKSAVFFGSEDDRLEIKFRCAVTGMTDNVYIGIFDGLNQAIGVLFTSTGFIA